MDIILAEKRIKELSDTLKYHNRKYYIEDSPEIPDFEYDAMLRELEDLEAEFPQFKYEDSPTQMVGGAASKLFSEVVHTVKMESLQDVFNFDELKTFLSKIDLEKANLDRIGVIYGVGIGGLRTFEEEYGYYERTKENGPKFNPFFIPKMISDISVGHISIMFGLRGPNFVTTSACASSTNALIDAFNYIRLGKADAIIAGGAEAAVTVGGVAGFSAMRAISTRNDDPQGASRPFSKSRDGFVLGEGGAALILEEYEHAVARGAHRPAGRWPRLRDTCGCRWPGGSAQHRWPA